MSKPPHHVLVLYRMYQQQLPMIDGSAYLKLAIEQKEIEMEKEKRKNKVIRKNIVYHKNVE